MPRARLSEQVAYEFRSSLQVRPQDVNYGGHLGNDSLISLVGAARAYFFHTMGLSESDFGDGRTGIIIGDLVANYRSEAFLFDELLIETHIGELTEKGFRIFHRIRRDEKLVALVETGCVAYDYKIRKISRVPRSFLKRLQAISAILQSEGD